MFDFTGEQEQQNRQSGPVPSGSQVKVKVVVQHPKYPAVGMDYVGQTTTGLLVLTVECSVIAGTYAGVRFWERLFLPESLQKIKMDKGQTTACRIAGAKMRAMLEAARGIDPKDKSEAANRKRKAQSWLDFNGLEIPVVVGIDNTPSQGKDGRVFWNNTISRVVTPNMPEYQTIMAGGEIITDGPVTGQGAPRHARTPSGGEDPGFDEPPASAYDDVPF